MLARLVDAECPLAVHLPHLSASGIVQVLPDDDDALRQEKGAQALSASPRVIGKNVGRDDGVLRPSTPGLRPHGARPCASHSVESARSRGEKHRAHSERSTPWGPHPTLRKQHEQKELGME